MAHPASWHHGTVRLRTLIPVTAGLGAAAVGYVTVIERNWFALRRCEVPVLPPGSTWHMTFDHAALGKVTYFVPVPPDSPLWGMGNGQSVQQPKKPKKGHGHGHGGGGGGNGGGGGGNGGGGPGRP